jgi:hypothetical protein
MQIIITLLVLIALGIVVGSNIFSTMTVIILNQPTISLPIGVWLMIAIGLGLLSSSLIQLLIWLDQQKLKRQIRQLQSRLQQPEENVFTYKPQSPPANPADSSPSQPIDLDPINQDTPPTPASRFRSYRTNLTDRFTKKSAPKQSNRKISYDDNDWDADPRSNQQLEWGDPRSPSSVRANSIKTEQSYRDQDTQRVSTEFRQTSNEVYDADFRLIQPPYKKPLGTDFDDDLDVLDSLDFDHTERDDTENEDRDLNLRSNAVKPKSSNQSTSSGNLDEEDWGFDFDDRDRPVHKN